MKLKRLTFGRATWLLVAAMTVSIARMQALDIVVNNNADNGNGTLRQAIQFNESLGGGNTILFSNLVTGTITLTNLLGELIISKDLNLIGPGAKVLAISGNDSHRVFHLTNNAVVHLSGLTITGGRLASGGPDGAGILQDSGMLVISNCIISTNYASSGDAGGGLSVGGTVLATGCTIAGNTGFIGGGISVDGTFTGVNCTVSGNFGTLAAGGINVGGNLFLTNCTISGNACGSFYGGGIYSLGNAVVRSSIIAGNTNSGSYPDCAGTFTSGGYNLIGANNGSTGWGAIGDQLGTTNNYLTPLLGALQDNGGLTFTMAPLPGSPVVDQGNSSGSGTDQRGRPRPYANDYVGSIPLGGDRSDIGAVELKPSLLVVTNTNDGGAGSLRQAITTASAADGDTITFATNLAGTIALTSGELLITKSLNIQGSTTKPVVVSGNNASRVFRLNGNITVSLSSLTISNGNSAGGGAGIYNDFGCVLALNNCAVIANISGDNGGGLANNGSVAAYNCTFAGNQAALNAGGIYTYAGPVTLRNCTIVSNTAVSGLGTGGGILNYSLVAGTSNNLGSTIVAGNSAASHPDVIGVFTSSGYNLIGKIDYSTAVGGGASGVPTSGLTNNVNHDLVGSPGAPIDPKLGRLQNNGGPTPSLALLSNSPAIDKGKSLGLTTDQRGAPRPFDFGTSANAGGGDGSDIGAFELGSPSLNLQQFTSNAVLAWPACYGDFLLQSVTNILLANGWTAVAGTPVVSGNQYVLTNGPVTGNRFYRLKAN